MPTQVLVFGTDLVPLAPEMPASGAGLRIWQIVGALREEGFEVALSLSEAVCRKYEGLLPEEVRRLAHSPDERSQRDVIRRVGPDVVVACHWPNWHLPANPGVPLVIDFHGPHLFERDYQGVGWPAANVAQKLAILRQASFFTCAGDYQRDYFSGWILQAGFLPDRSILATIPISLPPAPPSARPPRSGLTRFVYSGFFLPWQDPFAAIATTVAVLERTGGGQLSLYGGPHPIFPMDTSRFDDFLRRHAASDALRFHGPVSRTELLKAYESADVALDVMARNPERELAFTTRTVEYLWAGIPVIYNDYAELADYIRDYEAGWCVDPQDDGALAVVVQGILSDPAEVGRRADNARRLVRERFTWGRTIRPLADFCRQPTLAPRRLFSAPEREEPGAMRRLGRRLLSLVGRPG